MRSREQSIVKSSLKCGIQSLPKTLARLISTTARQRRDFASRARSTQARLSFGGTYLLSDLRCGSRNDEVSPRDSMYYFWRSSTSRSCCNPIEQWSSTLDCSRFNRMWSHVQIPITPSRRDPVRTKSSDQYEVQVST